MSTKDPLKKLYSRAKSHAVSRGIAFDFTREQWCTWWETKLGPEWPKLRGPLKGQYVMARNGDCGPYAEWNVRCITSGENVLESNQRRILVTNEMLEAGLVAHKSLDRTCDLKIRLKEIYIAMRRAAR